MKKLRIPSEVIYVVGLLLISFSVAMVAAADFGVSMIVAPAYLVYLKLSTLSSFFTFGNCEYIVQAVLFIVFCIAMRKLKPIYLTSFLTCVIYGFMLDMWRIIIPIFRPEHAGTMALWIRVIFYAFGTVLTSFAVAFLFLTYLYPQVYDFFVKGIAKKYKLNRSIFKTCFDMTCLATAVVLTFCFFGGFFDPSGKVWYDSFYAVGIGTVITTCINGFLIGRFTKLFDKTLQVKPLFPKFAKLFDLE